jgi:small subunit ribosomal protein S8
MSMSDPIADLITRIRNAQARKKGTVKVPASKMANNLLAVLKEEGFIGPFKTINVRPNIDEIEVTLKYFEGEGVIHEIKRVSTPGRRTYSKIKNMPKPYNGLGVAILSTSKGVLSDNMARQLNIGGEVLCTLF